MEDPDSDLEYRKARLSAELGKKKKEQIEKNADTGLQDRAGLAYGVKIASEFVSAIVVGAAIGWVLDTWLGTSPFGLIGLLLLGFAAGVVNVMRVTGKMAEIGRQDRE